MVKIKDLPSVDRPREKLIKYGPSKLSTTELLGIILRTGTAKMNAVQLAGYILKTVGTEKLQHTSIPHLTKIKGLGTTKSAEIVAVIELGKRLLKEKSPLKALTPHDVYESYKYLGNNKKEHFLALYFDTRNQEIGKEIISIGTLNASLVHPREVFEPAIACTAHSIIVMHNHPSGDPTPSHEDILVTKQLKDAGMLLDILLLDHLIITKSGYVSFKEQGLM